MIRNATLDWLRCVLVWCTCLGHIITCLYPTAFLRESIMDDWDSEGTSLSFMFRTVSALRPFCLPLLFFASGYAQGLRPPVCVWRSVLRAWRRTVMGIALNALLWQAGPRSPECSRQERCVAQGLLFDFTFCPYAGTVLPVVFQMWYTIMLGVFIALSAPRKQHVMQKALRPACFFALTGAVVGVRRKEVLAIFLLEITSVLALHRYTRASCYFFVGLCAVQLCVSVPHADRFGAPFVAFAAMLFHKFYVLGTVLGAGLARNRLASRVWPLSACGLLGLAASTNWVRRGNLTYPYMPLAVSRVTYAVPAFGAAFVTDRLADEGLVSCPSCVRAATFWMYISHPWFMTMYWTMAPAPGVLDTAAVVFAGGGCAAWCARRSAHFALSVKG